MKVTTAGALAASFFVLGATLSCAPHRQIRVEPSADWASQQAWQTWNWLRLSDSASSDSRVQTERARFETRVRRQVAQALNHRGFKRVYRNPDLLVALVLDRNREEVTVYETGAIKHVSSFHDTNFTVQMSVPRVETFEHLRMVVFAIDPQRGETAWHGSFQDRFRNDLDPHTEQAVASLLAHFPRAADAVGPSLAPANLNPETLADSAAQLPDSDPPL